MSNDEPKYQDVLDEETLALLGESLAPLDVSAERMLKLRSRIMDNVQPISTAKRPEPFTLRLDDGVWKRVFPKIEKKVLRVDREAGTYAYLLRVAPGGWSPPHRHKREEICVVISGEAVIGGVQLKAGDYHVAPKGSRHGLGRSTTGALLYFESAINENVIGF